MADKGEFPKENGNIYWAEDANASYYNANLSISGDFGAVVIASTATEVLAADTTRKKSLIRNTGDYTIYIGGSGVTTTTGTPLDPNACIVLNTDDAIYAITSSASSEARFIEVL